jgi:hypothetical protein
MTQPVYKADNAIVTAMFSSLSLPRTAEYTFRYDNTICGERQDVWEQLSDKEGAGVCKDGRWYS